MFFTTEPPGKPLLTDAKPRLRRISFLKVASVVTSWCRPLPLILRGDYMKRWFGW